MKVNFLKSKIQKQKKTQLWTENPTINNEKHFEDLIKSGIRALKKKSSSKSIAKKNINLQLNSLVCVEISVAIENVCIEEKSCNFLFLMQFFLEASRRWNKNTNFFPSPTHLSSSLHNYHRKWEGNSRFEFRDDSAVGFYMKRKHHDYRELHDVFVIQKKIIRKTLSNCDWKWEKS